MTSSAPPLTVALLTYNRLHYLRESLEAILNQTYRDFELLVLDNCSTDGTGEFILGLNDPRIRYVRNSSNISTVEFNCLSAYHIALGARVIVTHDDDIMESDMLECQMRFLDSHPDVRLVWTRVSDIDQHGKEIASNSAVDGEDQIFGPGEYITSFLKARLWPMPSGLMLERAILPKGYSIDLHFRSKKPAKNPMDAAGIADVLMPAYINRKNAIGYINRPLLKRRVHTNQFSHAASLSRPGIYLYRWLKKFARGIPDFQSHALHFDALMARFDVQEAITTNESITVKKNIIRKVERLAAELQTNIEISPGAFLAGLPVFMLNSLLNPEVRFDKLKELKLDGYGSATRKLLSWALEVDRAPDSNLLEVLLGRRIVVFGSAFIAALLVLEGRKNNTRIVACIDSNVNRHGRKLLGIPIQSLAWMQGNLEDGDVVIISSEGDHEHYIEAVIKQNTEKRIAIVSWKELLGNIEFSLL